MSFLLDYKTFDGLDNRKEVMLLLGRLGECLPEEKQARRRARFLHKLLALSQSGLSGCGMEITPCSLVDAYFAFLAITGTLGVPIAQAMCLLEKEISQC